MTFHVTLNAVELDAEERRHRAIRARGLIEGAGWLFDEHISDLTRDLLATGPQQNVLREQLYLQIDATVGLKARLLGILQNHEAEATIHERKHRADPAD